METKKCPTSFFEQEVPEHLIIPDCKDDILFPTEWVGLRRNKVIFVQVAYPIIPPDGFKTVSFDIFLWKDLKYKVFQKIDDIEGERVSRMELVKLNESSLSLNYVGASSKTIQLACTLELQTYPYPEGSSSERPKPNKNKGLIWMQQADVDFEILQHLFQNCKEYWVGTICFLAQQVAEKALKSGLIYFDSDQKGYLKKKYSASWLHKVNHLANAFLTEIRSISSSDSKAGNLLNTYHEVIIQLAKNFDGYYTKTRYPDSWTGKAVLPAAEYKNKKEDAKKAIDSAEKIRTIIKEFEAIE